MVRYIGTVVVPFSRERVWALMSDWTNLSKWDTNISRSELASNQKAGQVGVGTRYDCAFKKSGKELEVAYECVKFEEPRFCEYVGLATLFRSQDSVRCSSLENGSTEITAEFNLTFRSVLNPLSFVLDGEMQRTGPVVMNDIQKFIEEELGSSNSGGVSAEPEHNKS